MFDDDGEDVWAVIEVRPNGEHYPRAIFFWYDRQLAEAFARAHLELPGVVVRARRLEHVGLVSLPMGLVYSLDGGYPIQPNKERREKRTGE